MEMDEDDNELKKQMDEETFDLPDLGIGIDLNIGNFHDDEDEDDYEDEDNEEDDDDDDDDYEDSEEEEEDYSEEESKQITKKSLNKSINISLPPQSSKKKPPAKEIQKPQSMLSQKKFVNIKDQFDISNFSDVMIKKKKPLKKKKEVEEEENQTDTDEEEQQQKQNIRNIIEDQQDGEEMKIGNLPKKIILNIPEKRKIAMKKKMLRQDKELRIPKNVREILSKGFDYFTKEKWDDALRCYTEVVRLQPRLIAPYRVLGNIKEKMGEKKESLAFYIWGAQIEGTNSSDWQRIGLKAKKLMEEEVEDSPMYKSYLNTALYCFTRAFRNDETDVDSLWERCILLSKKGAHKRALTSLKKLAHLRPNDPIIHSELARAFTHTQQYHDAVNLLAPLIKIQLLPTTPLEEVSLDSVNLIMELYIKTRSFTDVILTFNKISSKIGKEELIPIDLQFNVCVAYFSMGTEAGIDRGIRLLNTKLLTNDPVQVGDLLYDLAENLYSIGRYNESLQTFLRLKDTVFDVPSVWVKIGECYRSQKNLALAIEYFVRANEQVPGNVNTLLAMSEIYKEMGDDEQALQILNQSSTFSNTNDKTEKDIFAKTLKDLESRRDTVTQEEVKVYYRHADAFLALSRYSQFLGIATALLHGSNDKNIARRKISVGVFKSRKNKLHHQYRQARAKIGEGLNKKRQPGRTSTLKTQPEEHQQEQQQQQQEEENNNDGKRNREKRLFPFAELLNEDDYFNLLAQSSKILSHLNRHQEASQYLRYALRNVKFENSLYSHQLKFIAVNIAFNDKNYYLAFKYVKYVCSKKPFDNKVWNLFNKILVNYGGRQTVQNRFLQKIYDKYPTSLPVLVMMGNQNKQTDNVRGAFFEYIKAYRIAPNDPLINLLIGVLILAQIMGRKQANRHKMTVIGYSFIFKYANLKGESQETNYNIARSFHQLGIYNLAIYFYNKVLNEIEDDNFDKDQSLKCESAFNLSLIYKSRGNINLANQILKKHIVV